MTHRYHSAPAIGRNSSADRGNRERCIEIIRRREIHEKNAAIYIKAGRKIIFHSFYTMLTYCGSVHAGFFLPFFPSIQHSSRGMETESESGFILSTMIMVLKRKEEMAFVSQVI